MHPDSFAANRSASALLPATETGVPAWWYRGRFRCTNREYATSRETQTSGSRDDDRTRHSVLRNVPNDGISCALLSASILVIMVSWGSSKVFLCPNSQDWSSRAADKTKQDSENPDKFRKRAGGNICACPILLHLTLAFCTGSRHPSCGRSSVLIRSLSRNAARFALRGVASVSITTSLRLRESQEVRKQEERHGAQHAPHGMQSAPAGE